MKLFTEMTCVTSNMFRSWCCSQSQSKARNFCTEFLPLWNRAICNNVGDKLRCFDEGVQSPSVSSY